MPSSRINKTKVVSLIKQKRDELLQKQEFMKKLRLAIEAESKKISELEGGILSLHELITGEKVN